MDHSLKKTQLLCLVLSLSLLPGLITSPPHSLGGEADLQQTSSAMVVKNGSQRLIGTAVSHDSTDNFAIIEDTASRRQRICREGDLVGKIRISKIQSDQIIVDNGSGEEVVVQLQRSLAMQGVRSTTTALSPPAAVQPKRDPTRKGSSRERYFLINGAAFANVFADSRQLQDMVEMQPGKGLGQQKGVRLGDFAPESLFSAFGLRTGDLLLAVNGQEATDPDKAVAMLRTMLDNGQAEIKVRRRARTYRFHLQEE
jgi:type II secretion system protein C